VLFGSLQAGDGGCREGVIHSPSRRYSENDRSGILYLCIYIVAKKEIQKLFRGAPTSIPEAIAMQGIASAAFYIQRTFLV
jgi:hypothetical protein